MTNTIWLVVFLPFLHLTCSDKKKIAKQSRSKGNFLWYIYKIYIKKSCYYSASVTMYNKFFICLCFWGRNLRKLGSLHYYQKKFILICLHSSTLVYIRLESSSDPSTFVHIHLDSSSDASTLVYICLVTRLHLSIIVYTRLDSFRLV